MKKIDVFILEERLKKIHNNKYKYPNLSDEYKNYYSDITIECPIHGNIKQVLNDHMKGSGCKECYKESKRLKLPDVIARCKKMYGDIYDIPDDQIIHGNGSVIKIFCKRCDDFFEKSVAEIVRGQGCPRCSKKDRFNFSVFKTKATKIHGNLYEYNDENYVDSKTEIGITCRIHGEFPQKPNYHLQGHGCPFCKESRGERKIKRILDDNNIKCIRQYKDSRCRNVFELPFDFYLPDYNIFIEFDGEQHFKPKSIWGGLKTYNNTIENDRIKNKFCSDNDLVLFRIKYNEVIEKRMQEILNFISK